MITAHRQPIDGGATRIAEVEEPRDLVERLARRVVDGLADEANAIATLLLALSIGSTVLALKLIDYRR